MAFTTQRALHSGRFSWTIVSVMALTMLVAFGSNGCGLFGGSGSADAGDLDATAMQPDDGGQPQQMQDAGMPPPSCSSNPQTYLQFVNSCTTDQPLRPSLFRLPQQLDDGGLPPLTDMFNPRTGPVDMCSADAGTADGG